MHEKTVERTCPICETIYTANVGRLKWGRETTCSRACSYVLRYQGLDNKVSFICANCGREFKRSVSHIKSKHGGQFCSSACHYAGRSTGASKRTISKPYVISDAARIAWKEGAKKTVATRRKGDNYIKSDEVRTKASIATARALTKGQAGTSSKLEDKVAVYLDALGAVYTRQFAFRDSSGRFAFVVDFLLSNGVVIEVNGTYWHADPRIYPTPINAMQARCLAKYRRKLESLQSLNVRVVEIWEEDIKQDIAQAVFKAYSEATTL